ncbi:MAG: cation:proton antiporter [Gemmatimonadota bacterium]
MHDSVEFLRNLALVLVVAGIAATIFQRLHLPVVFGYLLAGFLVGPHFPAVPLVAEEEIVHSLSELGVILVMFTLGLEFSLRRLIRIAPTAGLIALAESMGLMLCGFLIAQLLGWTTIESVFAGVIIAISSTTIIAKAFEEQQAKGPFVDIVFGVLVVEDLIAILLMAVLTTMSAEGSFSAATIAATAARLLVFLAGFLIVGILLVPRFIRYVVKHGRADTTVVASVGLCFASALLALRFGYSVALGAFLVGALAAESGVAEIVEQRIQPVRDLFAAVFFVAVGMLIDPAVIAEHWPAVLIFATMVITGKVIAVSTASFLAGYSVRASLQAGMSLAQIGEFSFIIAGVGLATGAIRPFLYPIAVAVSAITTLTTPWLIKHSAQAANYVDRKLPKPLQTFVSLYGAWIEKLRRPSGDRVRLGRVTTIMLIDVALIIALVIGWALELPRLTQFVQELTGLTQRNSEALVMTAGLLAASPLVYGLLRTSRLLATALSDRAVPGVTQGRIDYGRAPRQALTITLQLGILALAGIAIAAVTQPFLPPFRGIAILGIVLLLFAVAFWKSATNLQGHARAGAEILAMTLAQQLPAEAAPAGPNPVQDLLPGLGAPVAHKLTADSASLGRSLTDLNLRGSTGATVLAIRREPGEVILPTGKERLKSGDILLIAGSEDAIAAAREVLSRSNIQEA